MCAPLFGLIVVVLVGGAGICKADDDLSAADTNIEKASICFRIGVPQWIANERFDELMELFDTYQGVTDEITFFHSETHSPI